MKPPLKTAMSRRSGLFALLCLLVSLAYLGRRHDAPFGIDAVSAVTPGRVSVVGAVRSNAESPESLASADAALAAAQVEDMVRRAVYLSGGLHKAVDPGAEWVVVRVADLGVADSRAAETAVAAAQATDADTYLAVVEAVVGLLHKAAGEAQISLAVGSMAAAATGPASGQMGSVGEVGEGKTALEKLAADLVAAGIEVDLLDLATEEAEMVEVPDGGEAADEYVVPIAILECDNVVNVARYSRRGASGLANLVGLAGNDVAADEMAQLVDLALLAEVDYTVLCLVGSPGGSPGEPPLDAVLAGHDLIATDRISMEMTAADTSDLAALRLASSRSLGSADLEWIKVNGLEVPGTWKESRRDSSAAE